MKKLMFVAAMLLSLSVVASGPRPVNEDMFYVYTDASSRLNHYIPSGWMGDFGDLHMNQRWDQKPSSGKYSIQIKYSAERKQQAGWAGIYWQSEPNNWGTVDGGYILTGFKTLKFMARGEKGGEIIDKFMLGGITGQGAPGDSDSNDTGEIILTKDWKQYSLDISKNDLSGIIGGFGFVLNAENNPDGATFYIDEIVYSK